MVKKEQKVNIIVVLVMDMNAAVHPALSPEDILGAAACLGPDGRPETTGDPEPSFPADADAFAREVIYAICGAGVTPAVARRTFERCCCALRSGATARMGFRHPGKAEAIDRIWRDREPLYRAVAAARDKAAALDALLWIGAVTRRRLARRLGFVVPDHHLNEVADRSGTTPQALCERLARATGWHVETVAVVISRAYAAGLLDPQAGQTARDPMRAAA